MTAARRRTGGTDDPASIASLKSTVRQLQSTEEELEGQNIELNMLSSALEAERQRYQRLFQRAPLPYLITDRLGRISEANAAAGSMLQVEPRFLSGKPMAAFIVPQDRRRFRRWLLHAKEEAEVFRMLRRRLVSFYAELHVYEEDRQELAWVIRDVTEARQAEQRTWELNRELEHRVAAQAGEIATVYDQFPVGLAIVPAEGGAPRLNPRAQALLGVAFPFEDEVRRALQGEESRSGQVQFDGLVLEVAAVPLRGAAGDITAAIVTFDDVTARQRIERADREFVMNASHQLKTPITAIASAVAALRAGAADTPSERDRFLDHLESEVERMGRLIEAMLVLSRAERGEDEAPLTLVRLRPLLERLVAETKVAKGVEVELDCDPSVVAIAHAALIEEAVANVIANAAEHTPSGSITISACRVDGSVELEVVDTGTGMDAATKERAFERFFGSTTRKRSAGLGLAIADAAVRASGGRIELASDPGVGTTVRIRLPSAAPISS